jgi:hypothetical protein
VQLRQMTRSTGEVPSRSVIPAGAMYTKPSHSGVRIAAPVCITKRHGGCGPYLVGECLGEEVHAAEGRGREGHQPRVAIQLPLRLQP